MIIIIVHAWNLTISRSQIERNQMGTAIPTANRINSEISARIAPPLYVRRRRIRAAIVAANPK